MNTSPLRDTIWTRATPRRYRRPTGIYPWQLPPAGRLALFFRRRFWLAGSVETAAIDTGGPPVSTARAICARMRAGRAFSTKNKDLRRVFTSPRKFAMFATRSAATSYENLARPPPCAARKKMRIAESRTATLGRHSSGKSARPTALPIANARLRRDYGEPHRHAYNRFLSRRPNHPMHESFS
jgi:hypothetical protein